MAYFSESKEKLGGKHMPKSSKEEVIQSENIVLKELKKDASKSIDAIAKDHNFSRQKVWRIIKRLEKNKKIWG